MELVELSVEKVQNIYCVILKKDNAVFEVYESDNPKNNFLGGCAENFATHYNVVIAKVHDNVNYGRARKLSTKILKICESLKETKE